MDWKQIPAAPAYEINLDAQVRNKHTLRPVVLCGRRVVMAVDPFALAEMLFAAPEPGEPAERTVPTPHADPVDTERTIAELRRQVRELSEELERYTAPTVF